METIWAWALWWHHSHNLSEWIPGTQLQAWICTHTFCQLWKDRRGWSVSPHKGQGPKLPSSQCTYAVKAEVPGKAPVWNEGKCGGIWWRGPLPQDLQVLRSKIQVHPNTCLALIYWRQWTGIFSSSLKLAQVFFCFYWILSIFKNLLFLHLTFMNRRWQTL